MSWILGSEQDLVATSTDACNMSKYTTYIYGYNILNISVNVPNILHSDHVILIFSKHTQHTFHISIIMGHLPYEPGYIIPHVGNFTEETFCVCFNFPPAYEYAKHAENKS